VDGASLYALCRSWLKNGFPEESQVCINYDGNSPFLCIWTVLPSSFVLFFRSFLHNIL
jgi:hypothetical protein